MDVKPGEFIYNIRAKLQDILLIPYEEIILIYPGKMILEDKYTLNEYGIFKESTIHIRKRLRGGGPNYEKEINIKFIKDPNNAIKSYFSIFIIFLKKKLN